MFGDVVKVIILVDVITSKIKTSIIINKTKSLNTCKTRDCIVY